MYIVSKVLKNPIITIAEIIHILNGDALAEQFPKELTGHTVICREVLMDGPLSETLDEQFYNDRADYLIKYSGGREKYNELVVPELEQLRQLEEGTVVYLWFEYDLFCQVNYWQCLQWLIKYNEDLVLYWVRPPDMDWRGFGNWKPSQLSEMVVDAVRLDPKAIDAAISHLECYKSNDFKTISAYLQETQLETHARLVLAAQLLRLPDGRGQVGIKAVVAELKKASEGDFGGAFRSFCKSYGHYGLGDLQFRELWDVV